jgi:hypothetical protein
MSTPPLQTALLALLLFPAVLLADLGSYTDSEGLHCTWSDAMGNQRLIHCEGTRPATGERWDYVCYVQLSPRAWTCRDGAGSEWSSH